MDGEFVPIETEGEFESGTVHEVWFDDSEEDRDLGMSDDFDYDGQGVEDNSNPADSRPPADPHPPVEEHPPTAESRKKKKKAESGVPTRSSLRLRSCRRQAAPSQSNFADFTHDPDHNYDDQLEEEYLEA
ncbi:hypothetical protein RIF29_15227 [Crotalaria pallida]|uniref:Uncharacterized protein n=1 Tax=Crotalaria pallida TaxID=3830 RepID=A0AAN9IEG2_CROPI